MVSEMLAISKVRSARSDSDKKDMRSFSSSATVCAGVSSFSSSITFPFVPAGVGFAADVEDLRGAKEGLLDGEEARD